MAKKGKASGPVVGLDIGSRWIKAVEIRPGRAGATITGIGYEPTPQGAVVEDAILDPAAIGAALKRLFTGGGIGARKVVSSVSGQSSVVVRIIEVPKMTPQELKETMKWEVERHIPFPSSEIVMDFSPLSRPSPQGDDQTMEVLLAVCQEDVVKRHMDAVLAAKLVPQAIEVESVALPRALIFGDADLQEKPTVAIADIGSVSTKVCVYQNGELVFPRSVPVAGINLVRAVSEALGVDEEEADTALREDGVVDLEAIQQLSQPTPEPVDETQMGAESPFAGYVSPFMQDEEPEQPEPPAAPEIAVPPPVGFDLGDEFIEFKQEEGSFELDTEPQASAPAGGGIFDLDEETSPQPVEPVFDLSEPEESTAIEPFGEPGAPETSRQARIGQAIAPVLVELAAELSRSLDYYNSRNMAPATDLVICGGIAKLAGLAGYLESVLGVPVKVGDPLKNLPVEAKRFSPEYMAELAPVFSACIGLAMREFVEVGA